MINIFRQKKDQKLLQQIRGMKKASHPYLQTAKSNDYKLTRLFLAKN